MAVAHVAASQRTLRPPIRLRYLLLAGMVALAVLWIAPRARLAWHLHDAATQQADYGLCMAGPTGAVLLRDEPSRFWQLVRRRIVSSGADDRPLVDCAKLSQKLTGSADVARLHEASAREFVVWGSKRGRIQLGALSAELPNLMDLDDDAWPFMRGGVASLMKPSLGAKEAMHPVATTQPGSLRGLTLAGSLYRARRVTDRGWYVITSNAREIRAYRSRDLGRNWTQTSPWQTTLQGTAYRCLDDTGDRAFALEPNQGEVGVTIAYYSRETKTGQSTVAKPFHSLRALACDETGALLLTSEAPNRWELWLCGIDQPCRRLPTPPALVGLLPDGMDIARQKGTAVLAITQGPLVRVLSSRDDGRSYTPFTVAIDHDDEAQPSRWARRPAQLLAIAGTLLIAQEPAADSGPILALVSHDQGASWHALSQAAATPDNTRKMAFKGGRR